MGDAAVKKVAAYIRQEVPEMDRVYDLSLSVIFLNKLAEPGDEPLIESLAVRLLASQENKGGWEYGAEQPNGAERTRLAKLILDTEECAARALSSKTRPRTPPEMAKDIARQLQAARLPSKDFLGDNSNTQFAMMAVWVARRHGLPVQNCLSWLANVFKSLR